MVNEIIITGSRDWVDPTPIRLVLEQLLDEFGHYRLIHGDCRGVDKLANYIAKYRLGLEVDSAPAEWKKYGNAAGPIRNRQMLDEHPDAVCVIAFPLLTSKGTYDMIEEAKKRGFEVRVYSETGQQLQKYLGVKI